MVMAPGRLPKLRGRSPRRRFASFVAFERPVHVARTIFLLIHYVVKRRESSVSLPFSFFLPIIVLFNFGLGNGTHSNCALLEKVVPRLCESHLFTASGHGSLAKLCTCIRFCDTHVTNQNEISPRYVGWHSTILQHKSLELIS